MPVSRAPCRAKEDQDLGLHALGALKAAFPPNQHISPERAQGLVGPGVAGAVARKLRRPILQPGAWCP